MPHMCFIPKQSDIRNGNPPRRTVSHVFSRARQQLYVYPHCMHTSLLCTAQAADRQPTAPARLRHTDYILHTSVTVNELHARSRPWADSRPAKQKLKHLFVESGSSLICPRYSGTEPYPKPAAFIQYIIPELFLYLFS